MAFSSIIRALERSPLTGELLSKLNRSSSLHLNGVPRLPKGLVTSALAKASAKNLLVVCSTLEEASRWAAQLEAMGWETIHFYPTSEASPYEPFDPESEMTWGQMQVLADLVIGHQSLVMGEEQSTNDEDGKTTNNQQRKANNKQQIAIVATQAALQPHLPPVDAFKPYCFTLKRGMTGDVGAIDQKLARLGYERVPLVETEGQWSRRGDIVDVFPVSAELPVRLEWFGDELDQLREFDPATQRSLDKIDQLVLTPTDYGPIVVDALSASGLEQVKSYLSPEEQDALETRTRPEGMRRFLGIAFDQPASLLDYLPDNTLIAIDELEQCRAHDRRAYEHSEEQLSAITPSLPKIHRTFDESLATAERFNQLHLSELVIEGLQVAGSNPISNSINLASRPVPATPHQFAKLAEVIRGERDRNFSIWLISAQPSRSVSLLQEHDCPAQFVPNPRDYPAIDKLQIQHTPIAVKYSGLAELEGFILPTYRIAVITDREFFGQHTLASPTYVRKRRRAASKQVDPNKLQQGDYVVHKNHGIGKFLKLESLSINNETREYLVIQYSDGLLRVAADQLGVLSRFRATGERPPEL
ncbi:MAG: CarD family transcriptional regulator, partial [Cyanobacteriota bacterium]